MRTQFITAIAALTCTAVFSRTPQKVEARLDDRISRGPGVERVIIVLDGGSRLPELPSVDPHLPDGEPANAAALAARARIIDQFRETRRAEQAALVADIAAAGGQLQESFWLINGVVAAVPRAAIDALAQRRDVASIVLANTDTPPPTIAQGRAVIGSDAYRIAGASPGGCRIGLLDTGVRLTHQLFVNLNPYQYYTPKFNQVANAWDCVNGTQQDCQVGTNLDPSDNTWNHGTSSASILVGNNRLGDDFYGITDPPSFVSYKVYDNLGLVRDAAVRAFQAAVRHDDELIVAEIQDVVTVPDGGPIAAAANAAFDAYEMVIAAAGNYGPNASTVRSPAVARGVIAVGAVDAGTLAQYGNQSRGPSPLDTRVKPDVQAPTNTLAAANTGDADVHLFTGTSGATPYAAAAAAVLNGLWYSRFPGYNYAELIALGDALTPNNTTGAGVVRLPVPDTTSLGRATFTVAQGQSVDTTIDLSCCVANPHDLDVAIWWSTADCATSNMTLQILSPANTIIATSAQVQSVWEKARVPGALTAGVYRVRVTGDSVASPQQVYLAYFYRH